MPELNPYESPREEAATPSQFGESSSEVVALRRRVDELEKRMASSWLISTNAFKRSVASVGYFVLAYGVILVIAFSVMGLITLASFLFGFRNPL